MIVLKFWFASFIIVNGALAFDTLLNIDEIQSFHYKVDIQGTPVLKDENEPGEVMTVVNKHGQEYKCKLPTVTLNENDLNNSNGSKEEDMEVSILLKSMAEAPCLLKRIHWWTYEFCYGSDVKQYHVEDEKVIGPIIILGKYESEYNWTGNSEEKNKLQKFHVQHYVNGTRCDVNGEPRKTEVRFQCDEDSADVIELIDEPESCRYVLTIGTHRLCRHPYLKNQVSRMSRGISCVPVLNATQMERYVRLQVDKLESKKSEPPVEEPIEEESVIMEKVEITEEPDVPISEASIEELQEAHDTLEPNAEKKSFKKYFIMDNEVRVLEEAYPEIFEEGALLTLKKNVDDEETKVHIVSAHVHFLTGWTKMVDSMKTLSTMPLEEQQEQIRTILHLYEMNQSMFKKTSDAIKEEKDVLDDLQETTKQYLDRVEESEIKSVNPEVSPEISFKIKELLMEMSNSIEEQQAIYKTVQNSLEELIPDFSRIMKNIRGILDTTIMKLEMKKTLQQNAEELDHFLSTKTKSPTSEKESVAEGKTENLETDSETPIPKHKKPLEKTINEDLRKTLYDGHKIEIKIVTPDYMSKRQEEKLNQILGKDDVFHAMLSDLIDQSSGEYREKQREQRQMNNYNFNLQEMEDNQKLYEVTPEEETKAG